MKAMARKFKTAMVETEKKFFGAKKTSLFILFAFLAQGFFAQNVELEDLTTSVKKEKQVIEKESVPEFHDVEPSSQVSLPGIEDELPDLDEKTAAKSKGDENDSILYFEGNIGGGYPGFFTGDFALSRSANDNYFSFDFFHESFFGYASRRAYDGFFNHDTSLTVDGTANFTKKIDMEYSLNYNAQQFGLQGLSPKFYSTNLQDGSLHTRENFSVADNFAFFTDVEGALSSWYASVIPSSIQSADKTSLFRLALTPRAGFKASAGIFDCTTSAEYNFDMSSGLTGVFNHRVQLLYNMNLDFAPFIVSGNLGYVFNKGQSIVPFELKFGYSKEVEFELSGGLKSSLSDVFALQKEYLLYNDFGYQEQTDWFANFWISFPITQYIENKVTVEFAQTAFGNGMLVTDYSLLNAENGLYSVQNFCGMRLNSEYRFDLILPSSELSILWQAWWLDCPNGINPHSIIVDYSFSTYDSRWGFSIWTKMGFGGDRTILGDILPDLGASAFIRASDVFKFSIAIEDMVKFFTLSQRTLYGNYIKQSGGVSLFVSFYL